MRQHTELGTVASMLAFWTMCRSLPVRTSMQQKRPSDKRTPKHQAWYAKNTASMSVDGVHACTFGLEGPLRACKLHPSMLHLPSSLRTSPPALRGRSRDRRCENRHVIKSKLACTDEMPPRAKGRSLVNEHSGDRQGRAR